MKNLYFLIIGIGVLMGMGGCDKEPTANFSVTKSEYIAGDTVHLLNTSANGYSFLWTLPNGTTSTSTNVDYLIDTSAGFTTLSFRLEASDKDGDKNSFSKSVMVIPASVFSIDSGANYRPFDISPQTVNSGWVIIASIDGGSGPYVTHTSLGIYFAGITPPSAGTYIVQPVDSLLTTGQTSIYVHSGAADWDLNFGSISGQLEITITNGKVHAVFNNVVGKETGTFVSTNNAYISGNITCH